MGDVLVLGAERRAALQSGAFALPPPADSLLGRLEQIDHRLRQLEEKQRVPVPVPEPQSNNYFMAELMQERPAAAGGEAGERPHHHHHHHHHHSKSMPSSGFPCHQLHLKGNLTDRLHLLESRIRQLSFELDKGGSSTAAAGSTSSARQTAADNASCILPAVYGQAEQQQQQQQPVCSGGGRVIGGGNWKTGRIFQRSARELHAHKPKSKVKDPKEAMSSAAEKRTSATYRSEKRRSERTRLYRRWFRVGC